MYGSRIREMRKKRGLTLKEVAEATGYTIGHISQIERDLKSPFSFYLLPGTSDNVHVSLPLYLATYC